MKRKGRMKLMAITNAVRLAGIPPNAKKVEAIIEKMDKVLKNGEE